MRGPGFEPGNPDRVIRIEYRFMNLYVIDAGRLALVWHRKCRNKFKYMTIHYIVI